MSRYQGFSEPIEVLIAILDEQKKHTELLEKIAQGNPQRGNGNERSDKPENAATRERSNRRGSNNPE